MATRSVHFEEVVFADDLNAWRVLPAATTHEEAYSELRACQTSLHAWGRANRVTFDAGKEHFHLLSRIRPSGDLFKILGVVIDPKLVMSDAVESCVAAASWRIYSIIRMRRFYNDAELVNLYKSHVLSYIEYRTCAVYHASVSVLAPLDALQTRFLRSLGISSLDALVHFNLAPLCTRRDISILGVIHRTLLGCGPACFAQFFRLDSSSAPPRAPRRHVRHVVEPPFDSPDFLLHSCVGAARIYNLLLDYIVRARAVLLFQRRLQQFVLDRARSNADWELSLSPRAPLAFHLLKGCRDWRPRF